MERTHKQKGIIRTFAVAYDSGLVCARIKHGSSKNQLVWDTMPEELEYNPILVTCAEGLTETKHPFIFVARESFRELLEAEGATAKTLPLVPQLIQPIRRCLQGTDTYEAGLNALKQLSACVGPALNPHLNSVLSQLNRKIFDKRLEAPITEALQVLEMNGGEDVTAVIRVSRWDEIDEKGIGWSQAKVPTYCPLY